MAKQNGATPGPQPDPPAPPKVDLNTGSLQRLGDYIIEQQTQATPRPVPVAPLPWAQPPAQVAPPVEEDPPVRSITRRPAQHLSSRLLLTGSLRLPGARRFWLAYVVAGLILTWLLATLGAIVWGAICDRWVTLQYGDPRAAYLETYFGFPAESAGNPTWMWAVNRAGIAYVSVFPGGQTQGAFVLQQKIGEDPAGRQPVIPLAWDADHDKHPDLVLAVGEGPSYVWLLQTGQWVFRQPNAEESARLILPSGSVR